MRPRPLPGGDRARCTGAGGGTGTALCDRPAAEEQHDDGGYAAQAEHQYAEPQKEPQRRQRRGEQRADAAAQGGRAALPATRSRSSFVNHCLGLPSRASIACNVAGAIVKRAAVVRNDGDALAIERAARTARRLAFVAEQLELGENRKIEIIDTRYSLANAQRYRQMKRDVDFRRSRIRTENERLHR